MIEKTGDNTVNYTDPETGEKINCDTCYTWEVDKTETCTVYSISTNAGGQYQNAIWSDANGYATEGTGSIATNQLSGAAGGGTEIHTDWYQGNMPSSSQSSATIRFCSFTRFSTILSPKTAAFLYSTRSFFTSKSSGSASHANSIYLLLFTCAFVSI